MGFLFTLIYLAVALLKPGFMPGQIVQLHIQIVICAFAVLGTVIALPRSQLLSTPESYLLLGLLFGVAASRAANGWIGGGIDAIVEFVPNAIVFYLVAVNFQSLKRLRILIIVMVAIALYIVARSTIAYAAGDAKSLYLVLEQVDEGDIFRFRGLGFLSDPNDTAQYLIAIIPLLWIGWRKTCSIRYSVIAMVPAGLLLFGIVMTHSRGGAFALFALVLFVFRNRFGIVGASIVAGLGLVLMIAVGISGGRGIMLDDGGRMDAWSTGLTLLRTSPLFGVGYGQFGDYSDTGLTAHNSFILCLSELGLFGYFFWIALLVFAMARLNSIISYTDRDIQFESPNQETFINGEVVASGCGDSDFKSHKEEERPILDLQSYATAIRASLVGFLAAGFFLSRTYAMILYLLLGMAVCTSHISAQEPLPLHLRHRIAWTLAVLGASVAVLYAIARLHWAFD